MKETLTVCNKHSRNPIYPKKKPSPRGAKCRKSTPISRPPREPPRKSSLVAKTALVQQRERDVHIAAVRRDNTLLEEEYKDEIRCYMHDMERSTMSSTTSMDQQPEIRWHMRPCLVDFLVEIHFTFRLRPETLYLTLNIIDRYVSRRIVYIKHYQLVGCAALWIASKFEDAKERVPTVHDLAQICRDTYDESAFIQMEGHLLSTISWTLGHPTAEAWLRSMCGHGQEDVEVQHVARFLMEITLFYREFVKHTPSSIACGALTLARFLCGKTRRHFDETEEGLEVVDLLDNRLAKHINDLSETLVKKYSYGFYSKASTTVLQVYLEGVRFNRLPFATTPMTPPRSPVPSNASTPMSASTSTSSTSDWSDDGPQTPSTPPSSSSEVFAPPHIAASDKENHQPASLEPVVVVAKHRTETPSDQYPPQDFISFGRPALHDLNICPPRVVS